MSVLLVAWVLAPALFNLLFGFLSLLGLSSFFAGPCKRERLAFWVFFVGLALISAAVLIEPSVPFWPYLALTNGNLAVAYVFSHRVIQGRTSFLAHFVEVAHEGPPMSRVFLRYLRRQCFIWIGFSTTTVMLSITAMVSSEARGVIDLSLWALLAIQVIWFCSSHLFAQIWYGRQERWQVTLLHMMRHETWSKLKI